MVRRTLFSLCFVLFIISVPSLMAQTAGTGALTCTVMDCSGAVLPGVMVTTTSVDTGQTRSVITGEGGSYRVTLLPPGNYSVKFELTGFNTAEVQSVKVNVTETAVLDRTLQVGAQAEAVQVEAAVETIQTTSSALGTVATAVTITELPLSTRNYTNLLANSTGANASVQDASLIGKGTTLIAVNGAGNGQNTFLQDGIVINNWFSFNTGVEGVSVGGFAIPNPDAISEFKIQTSSYDAGYGRNPGANVNVVTKSGTNSFHGSAFEFFRNGVLNANTWFRNYQGLPKPLLNSHQYGGAIGGPIKKDKLFFFVSYQEDDQKNGFASFSQASTVLPPIPTGNRGTCGPAGFTSIAGCDPAGAAFVKGLAANMNAANAQCLAADPTNACGQPQSGSALIQDPNNCPGGGCDAAGLFNINPIAISIMQLKLPDGSYFVPSSGTSGFKQTNFVNPAGFKDHQGIGNVDYVINSKTNFSGRDIYQTDT